MQLRQPKTVVKVTQVFLQCIIVLYIIINFMLQL